MTVRNLRQYKRHANDDNDNDNDQLWTDQSIGFF